MLSSDLPADAEVEEIVSNPALRQEIAEALPALRRRAEPAGEEAVRRALQPLVLVYGVAEAARSPAFWAPYRILAGLPPSALAAGVADYTAAPTSEFFPKPGPLKALCDKHAAPILKAAHRAVRAVNSLPKEERPPPTEAERQAVRSMLADFSAKMEVKTVAKPEPSATHGKADEGGLTEAMRELRRRREGGDA